MGWEIILLIVLLLLSGFFSGAEVALLSLTKFKVLHLAQKKKFGAEYIKKLKDNPRRMLATILIGNNCVNIGASALTTSIFIGIFQNYAVGIATGVMTFLILVFGEITPKSIATGHTERVSQLVAAPIWYLGVVFTPVHYLLDNTVNKSINLFGLGKIKEMAITEEELMSMVDVAEEEGSIKEIEKNLINNIFKFDEMSVGEIVTPRTDMVVIEVNSTVKDAIKLIMKNKCSRLPVYEKDKDNIVGIVHVQELIKYMQTGSDQMSLKEIMKKPYFVPETKRISSLLRHFQKRKEHMAIVVDEHGLIIGLVTLEDVLEEIVGEIMDETDKISPNIQKIRKNAWYVKGKTDIDEVNDKLKMKIKAKGYDTFSGFIFKTTGKIPNEGDLVNYKNFRIRVEELEGHRISKVKVERTLQNSGV